MYSGHGISLEKNSYRDLDEAKLAANAARLIPPYNMDAETPEDAYPLHGIIPEQEWSALDALYRPLKNMSSTLDRMKSLPNARSQWVREHLNLAYATPKPSSKIVYARVLMFPLVQTSQQDLQQNVDIYHNINGFPFCYGKSSTRKTCASRALVSST